MPPTNRLCLHWRAKCIGRNKREPPHDAKQTACVLIRESAAIRGALCATYCVSAFKRSLLKGFSEAVQLWLQAAVDRNDHTDSPKLETSYTTELLRASAASELPFLLSVRFLLLRLRSLLYVI